MKLYTRPRKLAPQSVREGDQIAMVRTPDGYDMIGSEGEFIDVDLAEMVQWYGVHASHPTDGRPMRWTIVHSGGMDDTLSMTDDAVIVREVLDIDPWSYVKT